MIKKLTTKTPGEPGQLQSVKAEDFSTHPHACRPRLTVGIHSRKSTFITDVVKNSKFSKQILVSNKVNHYNQLLIYKKDIHFKTKFAEIVKMLCMKQPELTVQIESWLSCDECTKYWHFSELILHTKYLCFQILSVHSFIFHSFFFHLWLKVKIYYFSIESWGNLRQKVKRQRSRHPDLRSCSKNTGFP